MIDIAQDLDFYDDEAIEITKKVKDIREITLQESEFSREFSVPATAKNNAVFSYYANIDVDSTIDPHKAIDAFWTIDLSTRYSGVLEVKGCTYKNGYPENYSLVFYGRVKNLATVFGEDRLTDIDWSSYDHALTFSNVVSSWVGALVLSDLSTTDEIVYPLIDYYRNFYFGPADLDIEGNIANANNGILLGDLKPAIRFTAMVESIFQNYSLNLAGTILDDTELTNLFVSPNANSGPLIDYAEYDANYVESGANGGNQTVPAAGTEVVIKFNNEIQDDNNNWNDSTYTFTAPVTGPYALYIQGRVTRSGSIVDIETYYKINGGDPQEVGVTSTTVSDVNADSRFFTRYFSPVELTAGDTVQFFARNSGSTLLGDQDLIDSQMLFKTADFPTVEENVTQTLANTMPNIKVVDFINGVLKTFRWVIVPGDKPGNWQILSEADYRALGTTRDWSNYIDLKNITYNKPEVYKSIKLTFAETETAAHTAFEEQAKRRFGEIQLIPDVDFGQDALEEESIFTCWPPTNWNILDDEGAAIASTPITFYKMLDIEGSPTKDEFLWFFYDGTIGAHGYDYYIQDGVSAGQPTYTAINYYPTCYAHNGDEVAANADFSATYSIENVLNGQPPINNIFTKYWQDEIYNIYANGARVATADFYLPMDQFLSFELNDTIWTEGRRWYIDEFRYDVKRKRAKCTLRSKEPIKDRSSITTINGGGKVEFSSQPDSFVKSIANVGRQQGGKFLQQNPKSIVLNNKLVYTEAQSKIFETYITNIINVIDENLLSWGES